MPTKNWRHRTLIGAAAIAIVASGLLWLKWTEAHADLADSRMPPTLQVESSSFANGGEIPARLTCSGAGLSPQLTIPSLPSGTKSLAILMDDLDTPFHFVHWLLYDIPPSVHELAEGARPPGVEGTNNFDNIGYGGPCPPSGRHRYRLSLFALANNPALPQGATRKQLGAAMKGHVLAWGEIFGFYSKQ